MLNPCFMCGKHLGKVIRDTKKKYCQLTDKPKICYFKALNLVEVPKKMAGDLLM